MQGNTGDFDEDTDHIRDMVSALNLRLQTQSGRQSATSGSRPRNTAPNDDLPPTSSSAASISSGLMAPQTSPTPSRRSVSFSTASASTLPDFPNSSSSPRRLTRFVDEHNVIVSESLPASEKDVDDPNSSEVAISSNDRGEYSTHLALSRLFTSEIATTPTQSGVLSYQPNPRKSYSNLPSHLYTRGLLGGKHSDITIIAFGRRYNLHRIILDRSPFFANALTEPWLEATAKEAELHPEDTDKNITQTAFELALKSLYGLDIGEEGDSEALGLFATGCWLEMQELVEASIDSILRQMNPENLAPLVVTMTEHYYGRSGERILASAKAMLCRDGWEMPLKNWDGVPGDTIREIVGNDGFFVNGEWERWVLAKRLLDRRLKQKAVECGLVDSNNLPRVKAPETIGLMSIRYDSLYRKNAITTTSQNPTNQSELWISLYTNRDIEPILVLLDEGIHYVHLEFEQLQYIRQARDVFGLPVLPDSIVTNALWMQLELRQKVLSAREGDLELGLSQPAEPHHLPELASQTPSDSQNSKGKRKLYDAVDLPESSKDNDTESGSWDGNARPRKFWIPSTDCNIVVGGNAEPTVTTNTSSKLLRHVNRMSATIEPPDLQWAADFASSPSTNIDGINRPTTPAGRTAEDDGSEQQPEPIAYTTFPPFRFAVEFPNPRLLKEKKRVYSRTVFYAGSLWSIYIQKVRSQKNPQLGVYLHRAKEREGEDISCLGGGGISKSGLGSVDERIGLLEREMILRSEQRHNRVRVRDAGSRRRSTLDAIRSSNRDNVTESDASTVVPDSETASVRPPFIHRSSGRSNRHDGSIGPLERYITLDSDTDSDTLIHWSESDFFSTAPPKLPPFRTASTTTPSTTTAVKNNPATLPPYVDPRPTIKTYFKIYSPSRGGRLLSVYESAPDKFDFSQSWGWRSSTLMLDEIFLRQRQQHQQRDSEESVTQEADDTVTSAGTTKEGDGAVGGAELSAKEVRERERERRKRDGILRFMVVIGNL